MVLNTIAGGGGVKFLGKCITKLYGSKLSPLRGRNWVSIFQKIALWSCTVQHYQLYEEVNGYQFSRKKLQSCTVQRYLHYEEVGACQTLEWPLRKLMTHTHAHRHTFTFRADPTLSWSESLSPSSPRRHARWWTGRGRWRRCPRRRYSSRTWMWSVRGVASWTWSWRRYRERVAPAPTPCAAARQSRAARTGASPWRRGDCRGEDKTHE